MIDEIDNPGPFVEFRFGTSGFVRRFFSEPCDANLYDRRKLGPMSAFRRKLGRMKSGPSKGDVLGLGRPFRLKGNRRDVVDFNDKRGAGEAHL